MNRALLLTLSFAALASAAAMTQAETVAVGDAIQLRASSVETPARGITMSAVESRFGEPTNRHATVGQPPITRWDYPNFAVFFENDRVIHAVVTAP
ncbi:MAG: hypothetical protein R3E77_07410 [Steroidobacteraceae bacterium]